MPLIHGHSWMPFELEDLCDQTMGTSIPVTLPAAPHWVATGDAPFADITTECFAMREMFLCDMTTGAATLSGGPL